MATFGGYAYLADTANNSLRKVALLDGATTTLATGFTSIKGVAVDSTGRVYVTDNGTAPAKAVIQVAADGTKTTIVQGLSAPQNLTVSPQNPNLLYVVDNNAILEVTVVRNGDGSFASASITNTIGVAATAGYVDSPAPGTARFKIGANFAGLAVDGSGNILVADEGNSCIRKIAAGTYAVTTIAGIGAPQTLPATNYGFIDGALGTNKFYFPSGLVIDATGIIYVADQNNHAIRKIKTDGTVSTVPRPVHHHQCAERCPGVLWRGRRRHRQRRRPLQALWPGPHRRRRPPGRHQRRHHAGHGALDSWALGSWKHPGSPGCFRPA